MPLPINQGTVIVVIEIVYAVITFLGIIVGILGSHLSSQPEQRLEESYALAWVARIYYLLVVSFVVCFVLFVIFLLLLGSGIIVPK
jgi:hypothetical protein